MLNPAAPCSYTPQTESLVHRKIYTFTLHLRVMSLGASSNTHTKLLTQGQLKTSTLYEIINQTAYQVSV